MAKDKAKTIANKDEKLQVDTNGSVPENVPADGEAKEPKDAKDGNETKRRVKRSLLIITTPSLSFKSKSLRMVLRA